MQASRRNRIVINLDARNDARVGDRAQLRRWPRVLGILALVVALVGLIAAGGGYFWWKRYQTTPAYSLAFLVYSLGQNENAAPAFDQYVDTDKVINNISTQVTEKTIARYGTAMNPALRQQIEGIIPGLLPRVREQTLESVRFVLADQIGKLASTAGNKPFFVIAVTLPYAVNITTEGDVAKVTTSENDRTTELIMERAGDRWKITGIQNETVVQRIVERLMQDLPPIGAPPGERPGRDPFAPPRRTRRGRGR